MKKYCLLMLLCALPVHGEEFLVPVTGEVQQDTLLCWAAVSSMATRAFQVTTTFRPATQKEVLYAKLANNRNAIPPGPNLPADIEAKKTQCELPGANCNTDSLTSWLNGLASVKVVDLAPQTAKRLSEGHFRIDIKERRKPIVIRWFYNSPLPQRIPGTNEILPARLGSHYLLVTGYDNVNKAIRVWDPWPHRKPGVSASGERLPRGHKRHKWLTLARYANPTNDNGWKVSAQHQFDEFALRPQGEPLPAYPALVAQTPVKTTALNCDDRPRYFDFTNGPPDLRRLAADHMRKLVVRDENEKPRKASLDPPGEPIPIVAFGSDDLWSARAKPQDLLAPRTKAVIVPVTENGELVDSFLMLYEGGKWTEGGYSNNEIARLLLEVRNRPENRERTARGFYLVSIPEEGSFFATHGFEDRAEMIPLADDARGEFVPARQWLTPVIRQVERNKRPEATSQ